MQFHLHRLPLSRPQWIVNDPLGAAGFDGIEAGYAVLFSQPEFLTQDKVLHLLPLVGMSGALPEIPASEAVFFDGLPPGTSLPGGPGWRRITALKERVETAFGTFLIPENLDMAVWNSIPEGWTGAGSRDGGTPFFLSCGQRFLSPVHTGYVDFILRRDKRRVAWNWRAFLGESLARWLFGPEISFAPRSPEEETLRDAFAAFGFHRWVVEEAARQLELPAITEKAGATLLAAAHAFLAGRQGEAQAAIGQAYRELAASVDELTGTRERYFAEGHHGGMLHEDIGYFEHDWPQLVCDILDEYLSHPGVVISLDMPANVFRHYRERFPRFFAKMRTWLREGRLELLNGMYGQPYSDSHTMENLLSQCLEGQRELLSVFGERAGVFASEEYCLGPAMAQILAASGYRQAVHAVRLGGTSGQSGPVVRPWKAGIGTGELEAIEHPDLMEPGISTRYFLNLPGALAQARRRGHRQIALFNIPDFGWNVLYRDEIFTALQYAPVLFRMVSFRELFERLERSREPLAGEWEATYHTIFNQYTIRGEMRRYFERLREVEVALVAAEAGAFARDEAAPELAALWKDYLLGSSHDYTLVGAGFNGWYASVCCATYRGPTQSAYMRTLEREMLTRFGQGLAAIRETRGDDPKGSWMSNPHGFPLTLCLETGAGQPREVTLPPFGSLERHLRPAWGTISARDGILTNGNFRCEVDPETGGLRHASWHGRMLWSGNRLGVILPECPIRCADGALGVPEVTANGLRLTHRARLVSAQEETLGWLETAYLLTPGSDDLLVELLLCPGLLPSRAQFDWEKEWQGSFRYALPRLAGRHTLQVGQANALVPADPARRNAGGLGKTIPDAAAHVISNEVLGQQGEDSLWYYNEGFPLHFVYEDRVEMMLRMPGEEHLRLRLGIGFGAGRLSPVQRSRALFHPPVPTRRPWPAFPVTWEEPRIGLLRVERPGGGAARLWFFNYAPEAVSFAPRGGNLLEAPRCATGPLETGEEGWRVEKYGLFSVALSHLPEPGAPAAAPVPAYDPAACALTP